MKAAARRPGREDPAAVDLRQKPRSAGRQRHSVTAPVSKMAGADGDDSLYPIAVLIDELRNEDVQVAALVSISIAVLCFILN